MKKGIRLLAVTVLTTLTLSVASQTLSSDFLGSTTVYAEKLDDVGGAEGGGYDALDEVRNQRKSENRSTQEQNNNAFDNGNANNGFDKDVFNTSDVYSPQGSFFKKFFPLNDATMQKGAQVVSPVTNLVSIIISSILFLIFVFMGFVTVCDLSYIFIPFTRKLLAPQNASMQGQQGGGMGMGMGGGFGMGMGGGTQQQEKRGLQIVSDEVLQAMAEGGQQQAQGGINGGMGMGGFGMSGMGNMGGEPPKTKSIPRIYMQKRAIALIYLGIMTVLLLSSWFTDLGINVAMIFIKLFQLLPLG